MSFIDTPNSEFIGYCVRNLDNEFRMNTNISLTSLIRIMEIKFCESKKFGGSIDWFGSRSTSFSNEVNRFPKTLVCGKMKFDREEKSKKPLVNTPSLGFVPFSKEMVPKVDLEFPEKTPLERKHIVNHRWQKLNDDERKSYADLVVDDAIPHEKKIREKTSVKKPLVNTPSLGFLPFSKEMGPKVDLEFPEKTPLERKHVVNHRWQKLTDDERTVYVELAQDEAIVSEVLKTQKDDFHEGIVYEVPRLSQLSDW